MIIDKLLSLMEAQVIASPGTPEYSDNPVDAASLGGTDAGLGALNRALGSGRPLYANVSLTWVSGGDAADTAVVNIVTDTALPIDGSSVVVATRTVTADAADAAPVPAQFSIPIPPGTQFSRYIGASFVTPADLVVNASIELSDTPVPDHSVYESGDEGVTV